jgi:peptide deformylase
MVMALLEILKYGDPYLRKKAEVVKEITDDIRQLIADLKETADADNGVGLASTQVGRPERVFIIRLYDVDDEGQIQWRPDFRVFINPKLSGPTPDGGVMQEGCLSFPEIYGDIERPHGVTVEAMDENGEIFQEFFEDYVARQIMHENDHINGVLFIDRMTPGERSKIDPQVKALKKRTSKK